MVSKFGRDAFAMLVDEGGAWIQVPLLLTYFDPNTRGVDHCVRR